ncbi:plasmid stabilization protein [Paraburkholderia sediminicola]|uniref:plasmid stabilization protein n=1 Tax=Paraburkholderia sediminicola TaxID=458836 RepID=UPI0038BACB82
MRVPIRLRERLCVELGGMRPDWNRWCARRGMTSAEGVRQLIAAALGADANPDADETGVEAEVQWISINEPRTRIEIRVTHTELALVEQRAVAFGMTGNRWIVALIRAQLKREPQFGVQEMRLLSDSNQQLAAISRWLGQLAREGRALNTEPHGNNQVGVIRNQIDVHLRAVAGVIRANLDRWSR